MRYLICLLLACLPVVADAVEFTTDTPTVLCGFDKTEVRQEIRELAYKLRVKTGYPTVGVMVTEPGPTLVSFLPLYDSLGACSDKRSCEKAVDAACRSVHGCGVESGTGKIEDLQSGEGQSCSGGCSCNNASAIIFCYKPTMPVPPTIQREHRPGRR